MLPVYTTIQAFLDNILGTYTPMVYTDQGGSVTVLNSFAGVDWPYIVRATVFLITIFAVYRIIGSIISHTFK